jgi:hypothetical protein
VKESTERQFQVPPCCPTMAAQLEPCELHAEEPCDKVVVRTRTGLGLPVRDGGGSTIEVTHCPFCGRRVPAPPGELERLYQQARGAVLRGAVMAGAEPDGVTRDEAMEYAADLIRALEPLFADAEGELVRLAPDRVVAPRDERVGVPAAERDFSHPLGTSGSRRGSTSCSG